MTSTTIIKGQRADVTKPHPGLTHLLVGLGWQAAPQIELDTSAFLLGADGKVSRDEDLIFYNNPSTPFITYLEGQSRGDHKQFKINLSLIPANVAKIAFTLTIYEGEQRGQSFSSVQQTYLRIDNESTGQELVRYDLERFTVETAVVVAELYRHNGEWKVNAVGSGFSNGLNSLCENFGIDVQEEATEQPKPTPAPAAPVSAPPAPAPAKPAPTPAVNLTKIELKKRGDKINLEKKSDKLGEILVNLNWNHKQGGGGLFRRKTGVDLDLACLYELKNGQKGLIQSLGKNFGSLKQEPYILLDGDDRTGTVKTGENIRIDGNRLREFKRILVFTFIYEGVTNWAEADGVVTLKQEGGPDIVVQMNEHDNKKAMCAIAMLTNVNDETFSIERLVQFYSGHRDLDKAFGWGLRWVAGSK
ncbi:TerD family protein [Tumebacillus permanentifrigoris]|uniref:Tellurite resistance protein TerA n=1 Tax=Tumebacillus permanentifrigoris TaxID=378543 RepID=A0A316D8Z8_9BACL|nr:TerD family protein [Tumebacillus permanentifrigoris]PWK13097.1 tellurite resistance protein TerA [Tumebacillus permanentifrigoris]